MNRKNKIYNFDVFIITNKTLELLLIQKSDRQRMLIELIFKNKS
ncbi:hypothetical protein NU08_2639 [Flavobacterium anhuiense]|uniref:Uncharacterized protein n=1 Tax=Flavobacterium anhuiense TaxID=459526 RepID=A0A444VXQ4_9FLAO|nr:hypothetical protein NU08_2639 [Flavobacterium anhuiense]